MFFDSRDHMIRLIFVFILYTNIAIGQQNAFKSVQWDTLVHNFDTLYSKESVYYEFEFTSLKDMPLLIDNVRTTCGCAAPDWSYDPIEPKSRNKINIKFTPKTTGYFEKKIKVFFNEQKKPDLLLIKGFVVL